jgi:hypothetical protein
MSSPSTPTPAGVPSDNTTLVAVLAACAAEGFDGDFYVTEDAMLRCGACRAEHAATETVLWGLRRLEGASDPADMAAVLSLECPSCGAKGTAVVRFGPEAGPADDQVLAAVEDRRG